jgi:hypothetical protein
MKTSWKYGIASLGCCLMTGMIGLAQETSEPAPEPVPVAGNASAHVTVQSRRLSELLDRDVILQNGDVVGQTLDVVVSARNRADYVLATNGAEMFVIPFSAMTFNRYGQVQLPLMPDKFAALPVFTEDAWPNFTAPAFRQQVMAVYGPSGIGPAPNANAPTASRDAVNPADQEQATRAGAPDTNFPINNRITGRAVGGARTDEDSRKQATPGNNAPRAAGQRGAARPPVVTDAPANNPDAAPPAATSGRPQSRSGPAPRPSSTGEYNTGSARRP